MSVSQDPTLRPITLPAVFLQLCAVKWESVCFQGNLFTVINVWWEFSDPFIPSAKLDLTGGGQTKGFFSREFTPTSYKRVRSHLCISRLLEVSHLDERWFIDLSSMRSSLPLNQSISEMSFRWWMIDISSLSVQPPGPSWTSSLQLVTRCVVTRQHGGHTAAPH